MSLFISNIRTAYEKHELSDPDCIIALEPAPFSFGEVERRSVASCHLPYLHLFLSTIKITPVEVILLSVLKNISGKFSV